MTSRAVQPRVYRLRGEVEGEERVFVLAEGDNLIGAKREAAVYLPAKRVSRRHAVIRVDAGGAALEDLGSTNGTFVDGVKVRKKRLTEAAWVQFGLVVLKGAIVGITSRLEQLLARDNLAHGVQIGERRFVPYLMPDREFRGLPARVGE